MLDADRLTLMSVHLLWHDPGVDRAYYEEIAGLLHGLLIRLDDRLPALTPRPSCP